MKELSIEEKAKAYDEIIKKANKMHHENCEACQACIEELIPELKESEDERIRKSLIDMLKNDEKCYLKEIAWLEKQGEHANFRNKIKIGDKVTRNEDGVLVNLSQLKRVAKKQGEQKLQGKSALEAAKEEKVDNQNCIKPNDKVEPKFKLEKEKWYVCTQTYVLRGKIIAIKGQTYQSQQEDDTITCEDNCLFIDRHDGKASEYFRCWTIQDAKDGDVLATPDYILIFKEHLKNDGGASYCHYDFSSGNSQFIWLEDKNWYFGKEANIHPATKEQRDTLLKAMADAGYTFDFEKKELKKIEQKPADSKNIDLDELVIELEETIGTSPHSRETIKDFFQKAVQKYMKCLQIANGEIGRLMDENYYLKEQKPTEWSEEDERNLNVATNILNASKVYTKSPDKYEDTINWLKSLKDRVQLKREWNEENKKMLECAIDMIEWYSVVNKSKSRLVSDWLKSLRPQNTWKPSDEQMDALHYVTNFDYGGHKATLVSLYEQLKKLKE